MKKLYYTLGIALITVLASCSSSRNYAQPAHYYGDEGGGVTYQQFYDELSPHGNWISYPGYGYVWSPYEAGFAPYSTNGRWVYSSYGWTWVSNYRWGWAPFHYGRWFMDPRIGWLWVPGYEWAPAWVAWRGGGGYYGWAPLGPGMSINISINAIPYSRWHFIPGRYITHRNWHNYYVRNNTTIINRTTIINNNYYFKDRNSGYNAGPRVRDVERATNSTIAPVRVVNRSTPGATSVNDGQLAIYRPPVRETATRSLRPERVATEVSPTGRDQNAPVRSVNRSSERDPVFQNRGAEPARSVDENRSTRPTREVETGDRPIRQVRPVEKAPVITEQQIPSRKPAEGSRVPVQRSISEQSGRAGQPTHIAPPTRTITGQSEDFRRVTPAAAERLRPERTQPATTPTNRSVAPVRQQQYQPVQRSVEAPAPRMQSERSSTIRPAQRPSSGATRESSRAPVRRF